MKNSCFPHSTEFVIKKDAHYYKRIIKISKFRSSMNTFLLLLLLSQLVVTPGRKRKCPNPENPDAKRAMSFFRRHTPENQSPAIPPFDVQNVKCETHTQMDVENVLMDKYCKFESLLTPFILF